jgi:hypothetical protein
MGLVTLKWNRRKIALTLSVFAIIGSSGTAKAVVADQYLSVKTAPAAVCYVEMWNDTAHGLNASPSSACTGTLIRNNRVLTAGHCVPGLKAAVRSEVSCNNGSQIFGIKGFEAHPQYALNSSEFISAEDDLHDVALIDLENPEKPGSKKFITPMPLATDEQITAALENPSQCQLWGYGQDDYSESGKTWGILRGATIDYLNDPTTLANLGAGQVTDREIYIGTSVYAAPGDSGGPIVCPSSTGGMIQIATTMSIHTTTAGADKGDHDSAHEKISFNLDWINEAADSPRLSDR